MFNILPSNNNSVCIMKMWTYLKMKKKMRRHKRLNPIFSSGQGSEPVFYIHILMYPTCTFALRWNVHSSIKTRLLETSTLAGENLSIQISCSRDPATNSEGTNPEFSQTLLLFWFCQSKAMKSSPLLGPFVDSEFWGFSLLKI